MRDDTPVRLKSARGEPKPTTTIERTCVSCGASFIGLAPGKTGQRGLWIRTGRHWYGIWACSVQCAEGGPQ